MQKHHNLVDYTICLPLGSLYALLCNPACVYTLKCFTCVLLYQCQSVVV